MRKEIGEGELLPKGYGLAYRCDWSYISICYPIPLNIIVRLYREIYYIVEKGLFKSRYEKDVEKWFSFGFKEVKKEQTSKVLKVIETKYGDGKPIMLEDLLDR